MKKKQLEEQVQVQELKVHIAKVFVGKEDVVHNMLIGFCSGLHILVEDIPGVGKTTLAKTLARSAGLDFGRIQFTPDLLPGDIIGMTIWSNEKREFIFKPGAIMHQFILADEINRASARTQSSLLEAMQEEAVTVDGRSYPLPQPFLVVATQNPENFSGTFQLPEAQVDRFGISFAIGYPAEAEEMMILELFKEKDPLKELASIIQPETTLKIHAQVRKVYVDQKIKKYVIAIAQATRREKDIRLGMSPRATQHLLRAAQAEAFIHGRSFVIPEDVLKVVPLVLGHRIILSAEARMQRMTVHDIIKNSVDTIALPTGLVHG